MIFSDKFITKPWLITLPITLGDMICATVALNKIVDACEGVRELWIACQIHHIPLLRLFYPNNTIVRYWDNLEPSIFEQEFEWVIDCARTETGTLCEGIQHTNYISWNYEQDNTIHVNDMIIPAPISELPEEIASVDIKYPCWLMEASLAAYILKENVWEWVQMGLHPHLIMNHKTAPHSNSNTVVIAPNGTFKLKKYPEENWIEVINWFINKKWKVHILLGPCEQDDYKLLNKTKGVTIHDNLALDQVVDLFLNSNLVISNDCGPMHLSAALKHPTIAVFGPTNPLCWFCYSGNDRHYIQTEGYDMWSVQAKAQANPVWKEWPCPERVIELAATIIDKYGVDNEY
jgi:hypothetical protein